MKRDDIFPSKYLKAADLNGKPVTAKIASALLETLKSPDGKEQQKIVLYFVGAKKTLPLNMANFDSVASIAGDDTDTWPGTAIELYATKTQMGGKTVDCIRIRPPRQAAMSLAATPKPVPPVTPAQAEELNDALPF